MPSLIKIYPLEIAYADGAVETSDVCDNCQRVCGHRPGRPVVMSLRFFFQVTYGSDYAQVYAAQLY